MKLFVGCSAIRSTLVRALFALLIFAGSFTSVFALSNPETALEEYVNTPDPAYGFELITSIPRAGYTLHVFAMASQQWRTSEEVDRTLWSHWLAIIVPETVVTDTAMLIVAGGSNHDLPNLDAAEVQIGGQVAMATQSIVAVIAQVPNQPLAFPDEELGLREDSLVAYSWDKAMATGDFSWPVYLPMVKSVVRAMDTVQAVTPMVAQMIVSDFVLVGFSKRGAISWLTSVVDSRVTAISPGVIDFLNVAPHIEHHFSAYGFYSSILQPYVDYDIVRRVRTPEGQDLIKVIDPYSYLGRLNLPKFLINSSGDQFFPSDSARHYYQDLPGESLIRYVPNTDHSLEDSNGSVDNALVSLVAWYANILYDIPRPQVSWQQDGDTLTVTAFPPPIGAKLWQASNPDGRDFRKENIGDAWTAELFPGSGNGIYQINVAEPAMGWTAYYLELIYPGAGGLPQTYSTRIFVTPDVLPFEVSDPLGDPKGQGFWRRQIRAAITGKGKAKIDAVTLANYFPIPLFDTHVESLEAAYELFTAPRRNSEERAIQHCLALRLNVAHKELGWYTQIQTDDGHKHKYKHKHKYDHDAEGLNGLLWQLWQSAHDAFLNGYPSQAEEICKEINEI